MTTQTKQANIPTWKFVRELIRFRPWQHFFNLLSITIYLLGQLGPPLVIRYFFNLLTNSANATFDMTTLVALLLVVAVGRMGGRRGMIKMNRPFMMHSHALMHKNMLNRILQRPGADSLPEAPG
ncbi:MAG: hypothetical protein GY805_06360, partial [Chloroflexi bacterium]|nr:hypothetical protein [Chloroflexota bacterium]